jgi:pimeloyl-ACP methyl ester carboxylesterase
MKFLKNLLWFVVVLLLLGAAVAAYIIYDHYNTETKELTYELRKNTNGSYIELSGGVTHYELDGPDTGKVVVLLHGFSVPYYIWNGTYEYLTEHGFRVLRYDQFGRGYSDRPNVAYNKQLYFDQLKELLEKLHLKQPVSLVGVSFGGMLATDFTVAYPRPGEQSCADRSRLSSAPKMPQFITEYYEAIHPEERALGQMQDFKYPDKYPNWVEQYRPQMEYKGFRHAIVSSGYNYSANTMAAKVIRRLIICINRYCWFGVKKIKLYLLPTVTRYAACLKAEFLPVDDAAHLPYLEQADIVNPALVTFLKK